MQGTKWERVSARVKDQRRAHLEHIRFEHRDLPVAVNVFEEDNDMWYVRGDIRGSHERTIADDPYETKQAALEAARSWMHRHKHPARMVTEDRNMLERNARAGDATGPGGLFDDLGW